MEKRLKKAEELLDEIIKLSPGAIYQFRVYPDGRSSLPLTTKKMADLLELNEEEFKNIENDTTILLSKIHPEDIDEVKEKINTSFISLLELEINFRLLLHKKKIRWVKVLANPKRLEDNSVLWYGYARDITKGINIENNLKTIQNRYKYAIEAAKDGLWDWDLKTNEVYYSPRWKEMLGYKNHELEGTIEDWQKRVHPDDILKTYEDLQRYFDGKDEAYSNKHRVLCKDGSYKWILDRGKFVNEGEDNKRMVGTHTDINQQIEYENLLKEQNQELENFALITSHDLQEPLNSIISFIDLFKESDSQLDDLGKQSIDTIEKMAYRMKSFITDLLEYSKVGKQKIFTTFPIKRLFENLKFDLNSIIEKNKVVINFEVEDIKIRAVENDLLKVFQNIVINSIKYQSKNNKPVININLENLNTEYLFKIQDNGIGIEPKYYDDIFNVFNRLHTRKEFEGSGLGLSFCRKVIEFHNGKIWVESKLGEGSTFYFSIPKNVA